MDIKDFSTEHFRKLLDLYLSEEISEVELEKFEAYLKEEEYRDIYIKLVHQDSVLYQIFEKVDVEEKTPLRIPFIVKSLAAAIILLAPLLFIFLKNNNESKTFEAFTVSNTVNCSWNRGVDENNSSIQLTTGVAKLNFKDGSSVVVEAPVTFRQVDTNTIFLNEGNIFIKGKPEFTVLTERDKIVDIGTEFGVSTYKETRIQVHKGKISLSKESTGKMKLTEGNAVISSGRKVNEVDFINSYFLRDIPTRPANSKLAPDAFFPGTVPYNINNYKEYSVNQLTEPVKIDKTMTGWSKQGFFTSSCRPPFDESHSINGQINYSEKGLYAAFKVKDPYPMHNRMSMNQSNCWNAGSQQIWLAQGGKRTCLTILYSEVNKRSCLFRSENDSPMTLVEESNYKGFHIKSSDLDYQLVYFIPWEVLGFKIDKGEKIPFHLTCHWGDKTGKYWNGFLEEFQNFEYFNFDRTKTDSWGIAAFE